MTRWPLPELLARLALIKRDMKIYRHEAREAVQQAIDDLSTKTKALNYVADMTFVGADGEWHFKPGYDPQRVLDAIDAVKT